MRGAVSDEGARIEAWLATPQPHDAGVWVGRDLSVDDVRAALIDWRARALTAEAKLGEMPRIEAELRSLDEARTIERIAAWLESYSGGSVHGHINLLILVEKLRSGAWKATP